MHTCVRARRYVIGLSIARCLALTLLSTAALGAPKTFSIESEDAPRSLLEFGRQSALQILFASEKVKGVVTNAVHGDYEPIDALRLLLKGTPLIISEKPDGVLVVEPQGKARSALNADPPALKGDASPARLAQSEGVPVTAPPPASSAEPHGAQDGNKNPDDKIALQEITVTATRREESLEKVPVSISALSQSDLNEGGIKSIDDIASITPGLQLAAPYGSAFPSLTTIAIRGLNTLSGASLVGVYVDDTPVAVRLSANTNFGTPYPALFDLNRVEVERGPQGTLFGAGSEAGTVRFITNQPSLTSFSGFAHTELAMTEGGTRSYETGAAAGGPIVEDTLGFRVSLWDRHDGGYVDRIDPITGADVAPNDNQDDKLAIRAALGFQPVAGVMITPSIFYQSINTGDAGSFYGNFSDASSGEFKNGRLLPETSTDRLLLASTKVDSRLSFADFTSVTSYMRRTAQQTLDTSPLWGELGFINYGNPLGPGFPSSASDVSPLQTGNSVTGVTEEVRLASNQPDGFLTWVGGIFLDHRHQDDTNNEYSTAVPLQNISSEPITDNQVAVFAQGDFHLTRTLTATLGERVARVSTDQTIFQEGYYYVGQPSTARTTLKETPNTPRIALYYQPYSENLFYVSASKGFRPGGGNAPLPTQCIGETAPSTYDSDSVWSYELGAKNRLFGGRLQVDASVFHIKWSGIQQLEYIGSCSGYFTTNTGNAESNGFDLAVQALVTEQLRLNVDVGYANAYFSSTVYDSAGAPLVLQGDKIGILPQVNPPWDVNTYATYEVPFAQGNTLHLRAEYQYHSRNPGPFVTQNPTSLSYYPELRPNPATQQFNARVGVKLNKVDLTLFVENAFNSHPLLGMYQDTPTTNLITYSTLRPRTAGLSANVDF